ncbi:MAG: hypothetical protein J7K09_00605 [Desulfuromusa sp.]|nr:hypothetical protein [Desulfuromusa sp.]
MKHQITIVIILACLALAVSASAQETIVYPSNGQSNEQMEQDKFQCYSWAKNESGFDPMAIPTASAPPPQKEAQKGGIVRGAAGGALAGGAIGAITGNTKKGLKIGAATGAVTGGVRRSKQTKAEDKKQKDWEKQQSSQYAQGRNNYNRAYSACLEGRGYSVK